ncbi:MAG TPA: tRNA pseudouridine(38-40) synthase TruA [Nitrospiraceae bacterium]|nr:tRNA pseudouridine(38-40) synthase TruA [Nitrospiraceae bacterium]
MATFKLTIEYDGTAYAGWQRQPDQPTIQAALEAALCRITGARISVIGAGRTDAGVHALGQVASFRTDRRMAPHEWMKALNAVLPSDISIRAADQAADDFHARHAARAKLYRYRILNRRERSPFEKGRAWHIRKRLDTDAMREAASPFVGRHDFSSFQGPQAGTKDPMCHLQRLDITPTQAILCLDIEADRFLKQMVRSLVGTLVEVGLGKRPSHAMKDILIAKDRRAAGHTAPPHGLYLVRVVYS